MSKQTRYPRRVTPDFKIVVVDGFTIKIPYNAELVHASVTTFDSLERVFGEFGVKINRDEFGIKR